MLHVCRISEYSGFPEAFLHVFQYKMRYFVVSKKKNPYFVWGWDRKICRVHRLSSLSKAHDANRWFLEWILIISSWTTWAIQCLLTLLFLLGFLLFVPTWENSISQTLYQPVGKITQADQITVLAFFLWFSNIKWGILWWARKRIHYSCEDWIEKAVPCDHRLSL